MQPHTPPSPTRKKLGPLIHTYGDPPLRWRDLWFKYLPGALVALLPFFYGLWRVNLALANYGPAAAASWGQPWFITSAVLLILLLGLAMRRIRRSRRLIKVYQYGFRILGSNRKPNLVFLWQNLSGIATRQVQERFLGLTLRQRCQVTIYPHVGRPVKLDPRIPNLAELSARIKGKIYPQLLKVLRDQRSSGKNLYFGPLILTPTGITLQEKAYTWEQVSRIQVKKGVLRFDFTHSRSKKIPVGKIPNIELFIQLIQEGVPV